MNKLKAINLGNQRESLTETFDDRSYFHLK
jgi:hypothetical protein